ncbi:AMP deaminase-like isoform X2 [Lotus japonicus]|uniref:AMP deaminase-like isoform X2 n=1 Tax=Lotus japonicus TaxID=34305 RepID=UPI00258BE316|nr:AMP deaminase-like isoform X2 [Lotus japonicus]
MVLPQSLSTAVLLLSTPTPHRAATVPGAPLPLLFFIVQHFGSRFLAAELRSVVLHPRSVNAEEGQRLQFLLHAFQTHPCEKASPLHPPPLHIGPSRWWKSDRLPDVTTIDGGLDGEEKRNGLMHVEGIPAGLPRLHTLREGKSTNTGSFKRNILRPTSPKSPVASASAFESVEGSDDEDFISESANLDTTYLHSNGDVGAEGKNPYETLPNHVNTNGEQMAITASSMIRSHSVSGDLHGVQPDPIAADILRKEPEHETFARLKITPIEDKKCRNKSNI